MQSISNSLTFDTSKSVSNAGSITTQMEFIPKLAKKLQESPEDVIKDMQEFRKYREWLSFDKKPMILTQRDVVTNERGMRFSVTGNVLGLKRPRSAWKDNFKNIKVQIKQYMFSLDANKCVGRPANLNACRGPKMCVPH